MSVTKVEAVKVHISMDDGLCVSDLDFLKRMLSGESIVKITCDINDDGDAVTLTFVLE